MRECHGRGIKAYGAINTRLRDTELSDAVECAWDMLSAGVHGLIVADLGLAALLRRTFPEAVLHASTQISGTSSADAAVLAELGFSRMVCPRELSLDEIRTLVKSSPIGIEMFIHGAHCVSVSGQCSMSYVMGGRSGNRGDCAGPCRLPFGAGLGTCDSPRKPRDYALSLKDMCLACHVKDIVGTGVESLKIEGRLKGPEYTYGVVKIYRDLIDGYRNADSDEVARLSEYFSRDGFSDGYLRSRYGNMLGTKKDSETRQDKTVVVHGAPKVPLRGILYLHCGENARLTLTSPYGTAEAVGDVLTAAVGNPPSAESLTRSVAKLGQTPFILEDLEIDTDGLCGIAASAMNALRRDAADMLCAPDPVVRVDATAPAEEDCLMPEKAVRTAILYSADQLTPTVEEYFDRIYIPFADYLQGECFPDKAGVSLPDVMYEGLTDSVKSALERAAKEGRRVLVHSLGQLDLAIKAGVTAVCSHRFVVYNGESAKVLRTLGAESVTLSPEISVNGARTVAKAAPVAVLAGGRMPLMLCRRCPMSDGGKSCKMGRVGGFDGKTKDAVCRGYLKDRTGAVLPAVGDAYCMTTVFNSVPTWTDMTERDAVRMGISEMVYVFSAETSRECESIVKMMKTGKAPEEYRKLR